MKKLLSTGSIVAMMLATVTPALASGTVNGTTGPLSRNYAVTLNAQLSSTRNRNSSTTLNLVGSSATTGNVTSSFNTVGGSGSSGNASSGVLVENQVLQSNSTQCPCPTVGAGSAKNLVTGPLSTNVAVVANLSFATVTNSNNASIVNVVHSDASTGNVHSDFNTVGGSASSGDATSSVAVINGVGQGN